MIGTTVRVLPLNVAPSGFGGFASDMEMADLASQLPSEDQLLAEIRDILRTADLMTVTKKNIKQELERRFGMPLDARRAYINSGKSFSPHSLTTNILKKPLY